MANDITVTKNTTSGSERWDVAYTADKSGTVTKTMDTAGTMLDRDVKVSVTIPSGSATTPATSVTANPSISVSSGGLITATASATKSVTPTVSAGYVSSGTAGTVTVSGSNTSQLTTQAAQTIYPSTSDQTISSGKYLTGTQTVKGVLLTNLSAGNIKKDVVVKVGDSADDDRVTSVTGTYEGSGGGSGVVITDTTDTAGGTIRTITAVNLGSDTVAANKMLNGTTAHDSTGTAITGNIATKTASDLTASGDTVTVPAGYYASQATKSVSAGTAGTPSATKGTVSNHSVSVTPSVTNTSGYITGSTKTGTAVTVSASELVSGNLAITQNGNNIDCANYSTVSVNVSGGGASIATATMTNSSNQNTSIDFTLPSGRTPKAFFARLTSQIARNSSSRYYYVYDMRWDGSSTGGVAGNQFYMYSGTLSDVTSGYSYSQDGTTFTLSSTGSRSAAPGSFYNGTYELVYVY